MSEIKLISPLLDNFDIGECLSEKHGVRACPAMNRDSHAKYILKVISCPPTETQLDAMLLSGACATREEAVDYFKEMAEGVVGEAQVLQKLSALEGFFGFESWQIETPDDGSGFDVYLLSPYKKTLERVLNSSTMTHLDALNLGLDLSAALSVCRDSGYLYVDLKPSNIYRERHTNNGFKIGDIGFMRMDALKYTSLPDRYRSAYTAPEIQDAFSSINTTVDIYALGLILYQVYNGGQLPALDGGPIEPPDYADYEMAEIILKACAAAPEDRYQEPGEFNQALVGYMQRNGAHDTPIVPPVILDEPEKPTAEAATEGTEVSAETSLAEEAQETIPANAEEIAEPSAADETEIVPEVVEYPVESAVESVTEEAPEETAAEPAADDTVCAPSPSEEPAAESQENTPAEQPTAFSYLDASLVDQTLPGHEDEDLELTQMSSELSEMLNIADELLSHPTPEGVVQPDPIDVPIPGTIVDEPQEAAEGVTEDTAETEEDTTENPGEEAENVASEDEESAEEDLEEDEATQKPKRHWLRNILLTVSLLALIALGFLFYKYYYIQTVDKLEVVGGDDHITAIVTSQIDEALLNVVCSDTYGNKQVQPLQDGQAFFNNLAPNTAYTIKLEIDGFHKLEGQTVGAYATPKRTNIVQFSALTGAEDGSVILNFAVEGRDCEKWKIVYSAANEPEQETTFSGHMHTITGLTVGQDYTFTLLPEEEVSLTGTNVLTHTASKLIRAKDLTVVSCINGKLTATWEAPTDAPVATWTVHCFNDRGYDQTIVTPDATATFNNIIDSDPYTVEITAAGMSLGDRVTVLENSITVTNISVTANGKDTLSVTWAVGAPTANSNWKLQYTIDGSAVQELAVEGATTAEIKPLIPGCEYQLILLTENSEAVLGGKYTYTAEKPSAFNAYSTKASDMTFRMCKTPSTANWTRKNLKDSDYTTNFKVGEKASFLVHVKGEYGVSKDNITVMYVIHTEDGVFVSAETTTSTWSNLWYQNYGEFDIPSLPAVPGNYSVQVLLNGALAGSQNFTVTE